MRCSTLQHLPSWAAGAPNYLPLILPLGLMLGLLLSVGRLYRDSEMPVVTSIGVGPKHRPRPLLMLVVPFMLAIGACSPAGAVGTAVLAADDRGRPAQPAGGRLEAGRFVELPGGGGVVYANAMSNDGTHLGRVFVYRQDEGRMDVTSARTGTLNVEGATRYLKLDEGFRVEGPMDGGKDFRLMRYASNEVRLPDAEASRPRRRSRK